MLCHCIGLVDRLIILSVFQVQMTADRVMIFSLADGTPGGLAILRVERVVFCRVISMLLENVAKTFSLHKSNVLSTDFLSTVVFGMSDCRALHAPDILTFEV